MAEGRTPLSTPARSALGGLYVELHEWLAAHPAWAVLAVLLLLGLVGGGISQFHIDNEMTDAMPEGPERDRMLSVLKNFRLTAALLIHAEDPREQPDPDLLVDLVDHICGEMEFSGHFKHVVYQIPLDEQARLYEAIFPRRYLLLPEEQARLRTSPGGVERGLQRSMAQLLGPQASFTEEMVRTDPLGFGMATLESVLSGQHQYTVELYHGHLLSTDRRHAMVIAEPRGEGLDMAAVGEMLVAMREIFAGAMADPRFEGLAVTATGGPIYSEASANIIKTDVFRALSATSVGIFLIFLGFFRSFRVLLLAYAPPLLGVAAGIALLGSTNAGVHGLSLGFGAAMLGITVDYSIHLFTRIRQLEAEFPRVEAVRRALAEVSPSMTMGCLTTLIGFGTLIIGDTKVLRDMSTMAVGGIAISFVLCVVVAPLAFRRWGGRRREGKPGWGARGNLAAGLGRVLARVGGAIDRRPWPFLIVWLVITGALAVAARDIRFDGDIRNLDHQPDHVVEDDRRFADAFGAAGSGAMVIVEAPTLEEALQRNDRLEQVLQGALERGELASFSTTSGVLPSARTQEARRAVVLERGAETLIAEVERAAAARGFVDGYFEPFSAELRAVAAAEVAPLTLDDLRDTAVGMILDRRLVVTDEVTQILSLVDAETGAYAEDRAKGLDLNAFPPEVQAEIQDQVPGTLLISFPDMAAQLVKKTKVDLARLGGVCLVLLCLVLLIYYRRPGPVLLTLLPCTISFVYTAGMLALLDVPLNMMNVCGVAITLGVAIDYGVFIVDRLRSQRGGDAVAITLGTTGTGVLMSAMTTLIGLGTMVIARNPAMASMGMVVIFGVAGALFTAMIGVPAAMRIIAGRR